MKWYEDAGFVAFVAILLVVIFAVFVSFAILSGCNQTNTDNPCLSVTDLTFACRSYQFQQCVASEQYSEDQCYRLVGGGKP